MVPQMPRVPKGSRCWAGGLAEQPMVGWGELYL